jgi:hypothetical protein
MHHAPSLLCGGGEFTPKAARLKIDGEDPICVVPFEVLQPKFQRTPSRTFPQKGNTLQDFADRDYADENVIFIEGLHGVADAGIPPRVT